MLLKFLVSFLRGDSDQEQGMYRRRIGGTTAQDPTPCSPSSSCWQRYSPTNAQGWLFHSKSISYGAGEIRNMFSMRGIMWLQSQTASNLSAIRRPRRENLRRGPLARNLPISLQCRSSDGPAVAGDVIICGVRTIHGSCSFPLPVLFRLDGLCCQGVGRDLLQSQRGPGGVSTGRRRHQ